MNKCEEQKRATRASTHVGAHGGVKDMNEGGSGK